MELHLPPLPLAPLEDVADGDALNHRGGGGRLCVGVGRGDWPVTKLGKEASPRPSRIQTPTHTSMDACMYVSKDTHQVGRRARQVRGPHGVAAVLAGEPVLEAAAEAAEPDEPDGAILWCVVLSVGERWCRSVVRRAHPDATRGAVDGRPTSARHPKKANLPRNRDSLVVDVLGEERHGLHGRDDEERAAVGPPQVEGLVLW